MRLIAFFLLLFIGFGADARVLHVDNNTIKLSQTKTTSPALHIKVDGGLWYGAMYNIFSSGTLHVRYNNINYSVLNCKPFTDTTNYTYDASGQLVDANKDIYLKDLPYTYMPIDSGIPGNNYNLSFDIKYKWNNMASSNRYYGVFGNYNNLSMQGEHENVTRLLFNQDVAYININSRAHNSPEYDFKQIANQIYSVRISKNEQTVYGRQLKNTNGTVLDGEENTANIAIFETVWKAGDNPSSSEVSIYSFKIWDNDTLVRHFVPVPCGLQIRDFVVPSNGMWDIVEQKFYGNMGTGDFVYGIDSYTPIDIRNYTFDAGGNLIDANQNLYLDKGTNVYQSSYINTGLSGNNDNLSFEIKYKNLIAAPQNLYWGLFGNYNGSETANVTRLLFKDNQILPYVNQRAEKANWFNEKRSVGKTYTEWFDKNNYISNGIEKTLSIGTNPYGTINDTYMYLFTSSNPILPSTKVFNDRSAIYYLKIWDNDMLVRHFVPVPRGLQIRDFVVPSNGMWDIVEQKFYGNMGTGDFIYGIDE